MSSKRIIPLLVTVFLVFSSSANAASPVVVSPGGTSSTTSSSPYAGAVTDKVCDPEVYGRMREKAWAEAQRENYINQSMILKPDSVLALTCFDKQVGQSMGKLCVKEKSGSTDDTSRCEEANQKNAGQISNGLIGTLVNGKPLLSPDPNTKQGVTYTDYDATPQKSTDDFKCDLMNELWTQSQCGNLRGGDLPSLAEVGGSTDARQFPPKAGGGAACSSKDDQSTGGSAYNYSNVKTNTNAVGAGTPGFNPMDTKACQTAPYSQLSSLNCPVECFSDRSSGRKTAKGLLEASCQKGCHAEPDGSQMTCVPDQ